MSTSNEFGFEAPSTDETAQNEAPNEPTEQELSPEARFEKMLSEIEIPENIDPELLNIWLERERRNFINREEPEIPLSQPGGYSLNRTLAAFIGVLGMITTIALGLVRGEASDLLLCSACFSLFFYAGLGFLAGLIAEYCIRESTEVLAREIVTKSESPETNN